MNTKNDYRDFLDRLKLFISKQPDLIMMTLSNIFTMRLIGNKTHGDLAEIAIAEFINQYMYDFRSVHVGKELFRSKSHEEDIQVFNEITNAELPISLKAYGIGPLQLSTDKESKMFSLLESEGAKITGRDKIEKIFEDPAFSEFDDVNVLPLIYDEKRKLCNIMVFDYVLAKQRTYIIKLIDKGHGRKHPVYRFYDKQGEYICEVRYGGTAANALQRGLWTHTKNANWCFNSITGGWIDYSHNMILVELFSHALVSSESGHSMALEKIKEDIKRLQMGTRKE
jgi:hypothetical protein